MRTCLIEDSEKTDVEHIGHIGSLCRLSKAELAEQDIALVNLLCTEGLPGSEVIDFDRCITLVDKMAARVQEMTKLEAFGRQPELWDGNDAIFRMHVMFSVLTVEFGVRYNPAKMPVEESLDLHDSFIHGILQGEGGTCGTLPVLYVAVGRRLGYPLHLVSARGPTYGHLFARWDDGRGRRFNFETSNTGFDCPPDDYYRTGLHCTRPDWEQTGSILRAMSRREELADFLATRADCWRNHGALRQETESLAWACAFAPSNLLHRGFVVRAMNEWQAELSSAMPNGFPPVFITYPARQFPATFPVKDERDLIGLSIIHFLLSDSKLCRRWWEPMRLGEPTADRPLATRVTCSDGGYKVEVDISSNAS